MVMNFRRADLDREAEQITKLLVDYISAALRQLEETFGVTESPTDVSGLRDSLQEFEAPGKGLFVVEDEFETLVGVAGLRTLEPGVAEVKRMYVVPEWRGKRVGARLLDGLLEEAQAMGASTVRLDTARFMREAQRLYKSRGFQERTPYQGSEIPPHLQRYWSFFELDLAARGELLV